MKKTQGSIWLCMLATIATLPYLATAQTVTVDVTPSHVVNKFSPSLCAGIHSGSRAE